MHSLVPDPQQDESRVGHAMQLLADRKLLGLIDFAKLIQAVKDKKGVPIDITLIPPAEPLPR